MVVWYLHHKRNTLIQTSNLRWLISNKANYSGVRLKNKPWLYFISFSAFYSKAKNSLCLAVWKQNSQTLCQHRNSAFQLYFVNTKRKTGKSLQYLLCSFALVALHMLWDYLPCSYSGTWLSIVFSSASVIYRKRDNTSTRKWLSGTSDTFDWFSINVQKNRFLKPCSFFYFWTHLGWRKTSCFSRYVPV